ncbi:MAG: transposase [Myxococcota bacterium]
MPRLRSERLDVDATPYYHLVSRCVRRAFLCGTDPHTGKDFEYRRGWVEERLFALTQIFSVDLHAYAVMSNHVHLVVRVDKDRAERWSDREVIRRYGKLFRNKPGELAALPAHEKKARIATWRERLWSLSWLMRCLNEHIARRANAEDDCTGHFWEGRFSCQPLLDEAALLACMAYVDLNPVRAGLAKSLESSAHTSIQKRLRATTKSSPRGLTPFTDQVPASSRRTTAPIDFVAYLELLTWTGRALRGARLRHPPQLLAELRINNTAFLAMMKSHGLRSRGVLGRREQVDAFAADKGRRWVLGTAQARALFLSAPARAL